MAKSPCRPVRGPLSLPWQTPTTATDMQGAGELLVERATGDDRLPPHASGALTATRFVGLCG